MRKSYINLPIVALCCLFILIGTSRLDATPITYSFNDYDYIGAGTFTLDVGVTLEIYHASSFSGGTGTFGEWTDVYFAAIEGYMPSLVFVSSSNGSYSYNGAAIGGTIGGVLSGSQADLEWANFIPQLIERKMYITPVTGVPEPTTMLLLGLGLMGLAGVRRMM